MTLSPVVTSHWLILERTNPVVNPVVVSQKCNLYIPYLIAFICTLFATSVKHCIER